MIYHHIRYTIAPHQMPQFEEYARRWLAGDIIRRCGGKPLGYFLPKKGYGGADNIAFALISFENLAAYETYRAKLVADPDAKENIAAAAQAGCIQVEERSYYRLGADGTVKSNPVRLEPNIAQVAALFGEPSRAAILTTLFDGRALTASELARIAGVAPTAASSHLARLVEGKLLEVELAGRHRYYRLASPTVATVIEDLAQLTGQPLTFGQPRLTPAAQAIRAARSCYDHLAGELAVAITATLEKRRYLIRGEAKHYQLGGKAARAWFTRQGIDLDQLAPARYGIARQCLDWTERQPHLGGPLGAKLFARWLQS